MWGRMHEADVDRFPRSNRSCVVFVVLVEIHCESDELPIPIAAADRNKRRNFVTEGYSQIMHKYYYKGVATKGVVDAR